MSSPGSYIPSRIFVALVAFLSILVIPHGNAKERQNELLSNVQMLVDPSRALGLEQILKKDRSEFLPVTRQSINLGYPKEAVWLRLTVESTTARPAVLSLSPNFLDLVDFYVGIDRPGVAASDFKHIAMGDHRPIPADGISGLDNSVPLDFRTGEPILVFVRLAAVNSTLTTDIAVYSQEAHTRRTTVTALAAGVWFGSMTILIVIQMVFYYFDRKLHYLLLAAATSVAALVYFGTLGFSRLFVFQNGGIGNDIFTASTTWLGLAVGTLAGASIFELRKKAPVLYCVFLAASGVGFAGVVCGALGANMAFVPFGNIASIGVTSLGMLYGLRTANDNGAATRLRAGAYVALWCGVLATFAQRGGFIDLPNWVSHIYAVTCVVQTILLTAALGVRLRVAESLNSSMREEALGAAKDAEQRAQALVEYRTRELAVARQTAEDALSAELASQQYQVRFMEVISHQYRTPLAAIRAHVDNVGLSLHKDDLSNQNRLDRIRRGIVRLVEVLEVNLSRSRIQGSSFQPVFVSMPPATFVEAVAARGRDLLQGDIVTQICPRSSATRILADQDMLEIAILNLIENAVKFSAANSAEPIVVSCQAGNGYWIMSVIDRGAGIPLDDIAHIFEPMRRGKNAKGIEGTGMGLSQVARIVHAHRGTVSAESRPGCGTSVTITIPLEGS